MKTKKNMKNPIALSSILALALGVFLVQSPALAGPAVKGTGEVFTTVGPPPSGPGDPVEGWTAKILRSDKAVTIKIQAVDLNPHHAYTVWVNDVSCPLQGPACGMFLAGHIVGGSGKATFSGRVSLNNPALVDPFGGIHVVIADHGPLDPSLLPGAIKKPAGGVWSHVVIFDPED